MALSTLIPDQKPTAPAKEKPLVSNKEAKVMPDFPDIKVVPDPSQNTPTPSWQELETQAEEIFRYRASLRSNDPVKRARLMLVHNKLKELAAILKSQEALNRIARIMEKDLN